VVMVIFQSVFHAEIHQNDVFIFFKNYFWDQHIKTIQNIKKKLIFNKKNLKFLWNTMPKWCQNLKHNHEILYEKNVS
jgi:hypothetical protein